MSLRINLFNPHKAFFFFSFPPLRLGLRNRLFDQSRSAGGTLYFTCNFFLCYGGITRVGLIAFIHQLVSDAAS